MEEGQEMQIQEIFSPLSLQYNSLLYAFGPMMMENNDTVNMTSNLHI